MNNRKILLYALSGAWDTSYSDGSEVIGISEDIKPLQEKLQQIIKSKASDYLVYLTEPEEQEIGERNYEIVDGDGRYAKFYITEHYVEVSELLIAHISREMGKIDRTNDVKNYLRELWECCNIENWKYEYMAHNDDVINRMIEQFDKYEDCNTSFNSTMALVTEEAKKSVVLNDEVLEFLWERLGEIPVNNDGSMEEEFMGYEKGTNREDVWSWFDENYSEGVIALFRREQLAGRYCKRCGKEVVIEKELEEEYPYYCPSCDENMYSFEVEKKESNI